MIDFRGYFLGTCCLLCICTSAQPVEELKWRTLGLRAGIPQATFQGDMLQDRFGRLWIGNDRGLFVHDGRCTKTFNADTDDPKSLTEINVQALYEDSNGMIWVGMWNGGLAVYHPASNTFKKILPANYGGKLPVRRIWNIREDASSNLWISSEQGLVLYERGPDTFYHFVPEIPGTADTPEFGYRIIRTLLPHPFDDQKLILASGAGLMEFHIPSRTFTSIPMPYASDPKPGENYLRYLTTDLYFDGDSTIWCPTWSGGLMEYNPRSGRWDRHYLPGLTPAHDIGYSLTPVSQTEYLYANMAGLYLLDATTDSFTRIRPNQEDSTAIPRGGVYDILCLADSTFAVFGTGGLSICTTINGTVQDPPHYAPYLSEVFSHDTELRSDSSWLFLNTLDLEPEQNTLTFKVAYPEFAHPESMRYRFRLEGHDANWIETGHSDVTYKGLSGGRYVLHYQASTDGRHWRNGMTSPVVTIRVVLWKHPLVVASVVLILIGIILGIHRYRLQQLSKQKSREAEYNQKVAALEMTVLRAQMNPHFLFNSLNSIKNYILKEKTDEASHYLTKFSQLMRAVLQNSRTALISLQDELKALALYIELESLRFEDEFIWSIYIDPSLHPETLHIPPLLIQPYVENAIRHGLLEKETGEGILTLAIRPSGPEKILIIVEDNGIGRERSAQLQRKVRRNRSFGMQITSDRIALISKTLGIDAHVEVQDLTHPDGSPAGTRVQIEIPKLTAPAAQDLRDDETEIHASYAEDYPD